MRRGIRLLMPGIIWMNFFLDFFGQKAVDRTETASNTAVQTHSNL
jgi:hypothetical protein